MHHDWYNDDDWYKHIDNAIEVINLAAPGLYLYRVDELEDKLHDPKVQIYGTTEKIPYTVGNILTNMFAEVFLSDDWEDKERTSVHELLHALGFKHEHQRKDGSQAVEISAEKMDDCQYTQDKDILGLTRFDPFSIMLYSEKDVKRKPDSEPAWELKPSKEKNNEMSELDKVALNLLYRLCKGPHYNPRLSAVTGMWYCERKVMDRHNHSETCMTNGHCGPIANCHACRVLENDTVKKHNDEGRWQGWSGFFYCGKYFGENIYQVKLGIVAQTMDPHVMNAGTYCCLELHAS